MAGARPRLVLAMLLVHRNRVVPADRLADELWGDDQPADAAAAVRTHVFRLRRQLGPHAGDLGTADGGYVLRVADDDLDSAAFEARLAAALREKDCEVVAEVLGSALALWRGPALDGFADRGFALAEARRLEELRGRAVEARADALLDAGRVAEALADLEAFVAAEPERERARGLLMEALYRAGRPTDALAVYRRWCTDLAERGLEPGPDLRRLEGDIIRHAVPPRVPGGPPPASHPAAHRPVPPADPPWPAPAAGPPPAPDAVRRASGPPPTPDAVRRASGPPPTPDAVRPAGARAARLGLPVTSFVGRAADVDSLADLLDRARAVTVVGPGGVGKTRLALHVAAGAADRFPSGVVVCDLAPVTDAAGVLRAVARPLGVEEHTGTSLDQRIAEVVADRRVLVVVDNCEHVVDAAAGLVDTLLRGTGAHVLATSRERLAVDGEHLWPVAPLPTDGDDAPARRLFGDRARAADPRLPADVHAHPAVAEIVRRLDGLPLAIELAAARCSTLSVEDIAAALTDRFGLLTGGVRTTPRHRSLAAVVEWSYDLLDDDERRTFEELSVFAGRFDVDDAAAVAGGPGRPAPAAAVLRLAERSLLIRHDGAPTRFSMLESLREFGRRRLAARDGLAAACRRHADHLRAVVARADALLQSPDEAAGVALVAAHLDELRAAQGWLRDHDPAAGLALVSGLRLYALFRISSEVYSWTEAMAASGAATDDLPLVLGSAAQGAWFRGDFARARALAQAGVDAAGDDRVLARQALEAQGDIALLDGALDEAEVLYGAAAEQFLAAGEPAGAVGALAGGVALARAYQGRIDTARAVAEEALALATSTGVPSALAFAHYGMAEVASAAGDSGAAEHHARAAMERAAPVESRFALGIAGVTLATLLSRTGRTAEACAHYRDVISVFHRSGTWAPQWVALRTVVDLLEQAGNPRGAAVLLGALTASPTAAPAYGADAALLDQIRGRLDATLGAGEVSRLVEQGAGLGDDPAIGHAIRALDAVLGS